MKWGQAYGCEQKISYKRSPNCCEKDLTHWASTSEIVGKKTEDTRKIQWCHTKQAAMGTFAKTLHHPQDILSTETCSGGMK